VNGRVRLDLIVAVAILLALVVANATVYAPKRRHLSTLADSLEQTEQELRYMAGHSDALALVSDYLPKDSGGAGGQRFLAGLSSELDRLDLTLSRVEPRGETPYGAYVRREYKMQIEGAYDQLCAFMEYLEGLPEVVLVEGFDYRSSQLGAWPEHRASLDVAVIGY
jgi:hypothetical protein